MIKKLIKNLAFLMIFGALHLLFTFYLSALATTEANRFEIGIFTYFYHVFAFPLLSMTPRAFFSYSVYIMIINSYFVSSFFIFGLQHIVKLFKKNNK
jgi:hypothetical protein